MKFLKKNWKQMMCSLVFSAAVLAADITSRPYFAIGGGGLVMVGVITYWILIFVEGRKSNEM